MVVIIVCDYIWHLMLKRARVSESETGVIGPIPRRNDTQLYKCTSRLRFMRKISGWKRGTGFMGKACQAQEDQNMAIDQNGLSWQGAIRSWKDGLCIAW